jgi:hypothetical protein
MQWGWWSIGNSSALYSPEFKASNERSRSVLFPITDKLFPVVPATITAHMTFHVEAEKLDISFYLSSVTTSGSYLLQALSKAAVFTAA